MSFRVVDGTQNILERFVWCGEPMSLVFFFFSSRRRHTRCLRDWSLDVCSSDLEKHFLPRGKKSRAKNVRENLAKPRSAGKHKLSRGDPFAVACRNVFHAARLSRIHCVRAEVDRKSVV